MSLRLPVLVPAAGVAVVLPRVTRPPLPIGKRSGASVLSAGGAAEERRAIAGQPVKPDLRFREPLPRQRLPEIVNARPQLLEHAAVLMHDGRPDHVASDGDPNPCVALLSVFHA